VEGVACASAGTEPESSEREIVDGVVAGTALAWDERDLG
jgi:hypothetical protein